MSQGGGKRKQEVWNNSQKREAVARVQRYEVGGSASLVEEARRHSGGIRAGGVRGGSHSVSRCGISKRSRDSRRREAPGVRAA